MDQLTSSKTDNHAAFQEAIRAHSRNVNRYADAHQRFLDAWKNAVAMIGPEYFHCQTPEDCTAATSREQLRPDAKAIDRNIGVCSVGQGVFIGAVVSFFNGDWGAEICSGFGYSGLGDITNRLDLNELDVIVELMLSHTGW